MKSWIASCLLAALFAGCGEPEAPPASRWSLIARQPDRVIEQAGELVPDRHRQWGTYGPQGWETTTRFDGELPFVWSHALESRLLLSASGPAERLLRLEMWVPPQPGETTPGALAVVRLNRIELGSVELRSRPHKHTIRTPASAWREGSNVLEIVVEELRQPAEPGAELVGIALARVSYDEVRVPEVKPRQHLLQLAPGTAVAYRLEGDAPLTIHVEGESTGTGRFRAEVVWIDRATGEVLSSEPVLGVTLTAQDHELSRTLHVPVPERGTGAELRLAWDAEDDDTLLFSRVEAIPAAANPVTAKPGRPGFPIFLLSIDTLAANHMPVYGYERDTMPRLSEFARDAVVFEHCVTNAPWTLPSFLALQSGLFARSHNVDFTRVKGVTPQLWERWTMAENRWTLAEALRAGGWDTAGFVDAPWLSARFGLQQGFDHYDMSAADYSVFAAGDPDGGIRQVSKVALEWIDSAARRPFFAFLHCFDAHGPYKADAPFDDSFAGDAAWATDDPRWAGGVTNNYGTIPAYVTAGDYPNETPERLPTGPIVSRYDEGLAMTDDAVGRFLDELQTRGLYDEALIVVTADHGETMNENEILFGHGVLTEPCLHIPLLIKLPGSAGAGRRVAQTVQLVDVYPTLLDLAGLGGARTDLHGRSLVPLLTGGELPPAPTLTESGVMTQSCVVHEGWKLVRREPGARDCAPETLLTSPDVPRAFVEEHFPEILGRPTTAALMAEIRARDDFRPLLRELRGMLQEPILELYDLRADPDELTDLSAARPEKLAELQGLLEDLVAKREAARARAVPRTTPVQLAPSMIEELERLGYTGGD